MSCDTKKLDHLEVHLCMENYGFLESHMKDEPHVVANFLKKVLREMSEPLIPYDIYDDFLNLSTLPNAMRIDPIKDLVAKMPMIN